MATPTFKSFVSEKEIEEAKKKRQEEWEKVRKPDQPLGETLSYRQWLASSGIWLTTVHIIILIKGYLGVWHVNVPNVLGGKVSFMLRHVVRQQS